MIDVRVNGYSIKQLLAGPPTTQDSMDSVCRTLDLSPQHVDGLEAYLGQSVELWHGDERWFVGPLLTRSIDEQGKLTYAVHDPLFYLKKNPEDYFFKGETTKQAAVKVAANCGVRVGKLADTKAVHKALYYQKSEGDKVITDGLARTYRENGRRFWFRYNPDVTSEGLTIFEQLVPKEMWAFQRGVNLTAASFSESIEEMSNVVKLINRESGKVVTRVHASFVMRFGKMTRFEEVDNEKAKNMDTLAKQYLDESAVIKTTMQISGVNPGSMGQFFSGDVIYVEERYTRLLGAYFITSVGQTFQDDGVVLLDFELEKAAHIPAIQYEDATENPKATAAGTGVQQNYGKEAGDSLKKYGIDGTAEEAKAKLVEEREKKIAAAVNFERAKNWG